MEERRARSRYPIWDSLLEVARDCEKNPYRFGPRWKYQLVNWSLQGFRFKGYRDLQVGGRYQFLLDLPAFGEPIQLTGRVVWTSPDRLGPETPKFLTEFGVAVETVQAGSERLERLEQDPLARIVRRKVRR